MKPASPDKPIEGPMSPKTTWVIEAVYADNTTIRSTFSHYPANRWKVIKHSKSDDGYRCVQAKLFTIITQCTEVDFCIKQQKMTPTEVPIEEYLKRVGEDEEE